MMGSGKSTIGPALADHMQYDFVDTDALIESRGKPIAMIFSEDGEERFRQMEHETLKDLCAQDRSMVISTGGGMPVWHNGIDIMRNAGTVVYLEVPINQLVDRLSSSTATRPLLSDSDSLESRLSSLLQAREHIYKQADFSIVNDEDTDQIIRKLQPLIESDQSSSS